VAFIVEDGTGIEDANAYVDPGFVENYFYADRLAQFKALSADEKLAAIITGTQYIDITYEWIGDRCSLSQGLNWPRDDAELHGFVIEGVPAAIKKATCEAAYLYLTGEELYSNENNKEVAHERIEGAVDISYVNPKDKLKESQSRFEILDKLVRDFCAQKDDGGPSVGSSPVVRV